MVHALHVVEPRRANLDPDPALSYTLPGWAYVDPEIFEREKEAIFYRHWHYAGAADELRNPGDYVTASILDQNVIVIRGKDGVLRGFYNVCQHRAHELLSGRGNAKIVTCPYHAWSYHADGKLRTARGAEKVAGFDKKEFCLKSVRVEVFADLFVFFNLDPDAVPLSEQAADLAEEIRTEIPRFSELTSRPLAAWGDPIEANWKVVVDNYLECYHCRPAHPAFADLVDMDGYKTEAKGIWSSQKGGIGRFDNKAYAVAKDAPVQDARFWWLWPTTTFNSLPGQNGLSVGQFMPAGPTTCLSLGQNFMLPGEVRDTERQAYGANVLGPEDNMLCEAVQRGLASRGYGAGRFIHDPEGGETTEAAVHHFHRLVANALNL